jgi:uncharacterized protein (DUF2062 family)
MKPIRKYLGKKLDDSRRNLLDYLRQGVTPSKLSLAVAVGIFIAFIPMVGVHSGLAFLMALLLRVNPVVVFIGTQVSNPLTFPFQLLLSVQTGHLIMHGTLLPLSWSDEINWLDTLIWPTLIGGLALAFAFSVLVYLITYRFLQRREKKSPPSSGKQAAA